MMKKCKMFFFHSKIDGLFEMSLLNLEPNFKMIGCKSLIFNIFYLMFMTSHNLKLFIIYFDFIILKTVMYYLIFRILFGFYFDKEMCIFRKMLHFILLVSCAFNNKKYSFCTILTQQ